MGWILCITLLAASIYLALQVSKANRQANEAREEARRNAEETDQRIQSLAAEKLTLQKENISLRPFTEVRDTTAEVDRLRVAGASLLAQAEADAADLRSSAAAEAETVRREARAAQAEAKAKHEEALAAAHRQANTVVNDAIRRAEQVAGDAYRALQEADSLKAATIAMKNVIEGYGDRYLVPTASLLDQLGETYGFDDAGKALTAARDLSRSLVVSERAADCSYAEANRRETAIRFVLDAFNGKIDTILSKVRAENAGTLEQQIRDAFALVNLNGKAFRDARITPDYLNARVEELKAAAAVQALREREKEEQRRIREQIREEEKARREIEKALKDAAKEEDALQRALERVQQQAARANDEQRAQFMVQLAELQGRLAEAEAKNQRALSMAQQTKAGHVYVISNVGSFGENVLKVGMTRRLEPFDRIRELGDASVPFEFDVHAMIWTDDAPSLERKLHQQFVKNQINKVNPRKEFFRVGVAEIKSSIETLGLEATWTVASVAAQYRETLAIERALAAGTPLAQNWLRDQMAFDPEAPLDAAFSEDLAN